MTLLKALFLLFAFFKLNACDYTCSAPNVYRNRLEIMGQELHDYMYTIYSSAVYSDNEIFGFKPVKRANIVHTQTTNSLFTSRGCCATLNITMTESYNTQIDYHFEYDISTDAACSIQLQQNAYIKLMERNVIGNERCIILWTCRPSREGVHAFCHAPTVSPKMDNWIQSEYAKRDLKPVPYVQDPNFDYKDGPCFEHFNYKRSFT